MSRMVVALSVTVCLAAGCGGPDPARELEQLQGTWKTEDVNEPFDVILIRGDVWTYPGRELEAMASKLHLDPAQQPKHIDFISDGRTLPAIYELDDDKLRVCWPVNFDVPRPTAFRANPDWNLHTYRRVKERRR